VPCRVSASAIAPIRGDRSLPGRIHALLRLVQKRWPPEPPPSGPGEVLCRTVCNEYQEWLRVQRGLAKASIDGLMWEGRPFLSWYTERSHATSFISIRDIDAYFEMRALGLRRRSPRCRVPEPREGTSEFPVDQRVARRLRAMSGRSPQRHHSNQQSCSVIVAPLARPPSADYLISRLRIFSLVYGCGQAWRQAEERGAKIAS
jgi:hypothetical protein